MKTVLLYVSHQSHDFNTSVAALASVARDSGFEYELCGISDGESVEQVAERVCSLDPQIIAATFFTRDIPGFYSLLPILKRRTGAFIAVGGYHATLRTREVARWAGVDGICVGEGERPFRTLLQTITAGR